MSSGILAAIKNAAVKTGVDFSYLVKKAAQESGFDSTAKAATSSATGLYQFTSQTWLGMIKNNGAQYGLGNYAAQISTDANGHLSVSDPTARQAILALRNDPQISAEMAGELDKQNAASLQSTVGGKIGGTELYLAHFLGAGGASDFLTAMQSSPTAAAASVLPEAAAANPSVFYGKDGQPRSLQQIYQHFAQKFDAPLQNGGTTQVASVSAITAKAATSAATAASYAATASASAAFASQIMAANMSPSPRSTALYSTAMDATPTTSGLRATTGAGGINLSGSSTLFAAMILGQMNGVSAASPGSDTVNGVDADGRKKSSLQVLGDVA